ncbi:MAG: ABC transporter ATP-binding protein [Myxococcales bacterium]|nr:ABC transporter ATP-binding protein [Myxococcales bacterium]
MNPHLSKSTNAQMIARFSDRYARRYLPVYALGLLFLAATNWLTVWIPQLQKEVFDELAAGKNAHVVYVHAWWIAGAAVAVIVVRTLSRILFFNPGRAIEFRLRNDMLDRLLGMSPAFFRDWPIGDLMARAGDDAAFVRALVGFAVIMALNMLLAAGMSLWQMFNTDAALTAMCLVPALLAIYVLCTGVSWAMALMVETQVALGNVSDVVLETYKGIAVVQGAAAESVFLHRFDVANQHYMRLNIRQAAVRTFFMPVVGVVGNLCIFLLLWQGGKDVIARQMTLGDLAAYASYIAVLVGALASGGWVVGVLQRGIVSLRRCWDVAELESDLQTGSVALPAKTGPTTDQGLHLQVRDLTVRHPGASADVPAAVSNLSFDLQPGKVLGIYGPVASGKSTLTMALGRLIAVPRGCVTYDRVDLCDVRDSDLRRAVAIVPQEAFLFSRTLLQNVGFDDPLDRIDTARADQAISDAQLAGEVARMPQGLQTIVGERGLLLSGGQRQRAQLARALYRGGRLLILDDVLSAVDHETEERLLSVIGGHIVGGGMSAIVISHRLTALARADEIIVLADPASDRRGTVIERGTHSQLLALQGTYATVWAAQQEPAEASSTRAPVGADNRQVVQPDPQDQSPLTEAAA